MSPPRICTRFLEWIARLAVRRYKLVLFCAMLLTIASMIPPYVIGWRFAFDISKMLPQQIPAARAFTRAVVDFDSVDEAVVVFRLMDGMNQVPQAGEVAEKIAERLRADDEIAAAFCRKWSEEELNYLLDTELPKRGLLLLSEERLQQVKANLTPGRIRRSVKRTLRRLFDATGQDRNTQEMIAFDALRFASLFQAEMKELNPAADGDLNSKGYIVAEIPPEKAHIVSDGAKAMLLLIIQPTQPAQSADFSMRIMDLIHNVTEEELAKNLPPAARNRIRVEYGGGYEIATRYGARVNETLLWTLGTSLIGVIALFGYCFRRYGVLIYIGVPLIMVVSWTIGMGWIIFGQLNMVSCAFAAVLVGLGVDYAVHIYNRYIEERARGETVEESFVISLTHTGWAIFIGMVTTCMAFLALKATRFTQLSQFGVLAGLGIGLSVPGMLLVLPALLAWRSQTQLEQGWSLRPSPFGLPWLSDVVERRRRAVIAVGLLVAVVCLLRVGFMKDALNFDERISSLRPSERAFELGGEIAKVFSDNNPNKLLLLAYGKTEREALETTARLTEGCRALQEEGLLQTYESVMRYLPSPGEQERRLAILKDIDWTRVEEDFRAALDEEGLETTPFHRTFSLLQQHGALVQQPDPILLPSMLYETPIGKWAKRLVTRRRRRIDLRDPIPAEIQFPATLAKPAIDRDGRIRIPAGNKVTREDLARIGPKGDLLESTGQNDPHGNPVHFNWVKRVTLIGEGWTVKSNIYPPVVAGSKTADLKIDDAWLTQVRGKLGLNPRDADGKGGAFLTGTSVLAHELAGVVKEDFWNVSLAVFGVAVLVLLLFFHRHPLRVAYCLFPIVLGLIYLFGIMSFGQIHFNFINVLAVPIIIGLGVDNGIHLVTRFYEAGRRTRPMVCDTGRAIVITSLTSMIGFGSLAVGGYRGITSMGVLSIIALASSLVASLVVFPAVLRVWSPPEEAPADPTQDQD